MTTRRSFLKAFAALPLVGGVIAKILSTETQDSLTGGQVDDLAMLAQRNLGRNKMCEIEVDLAALNKGVETVNQEEARSWLMPIPAGPKGELGYIWQYMPGGTKV